LFIAAFAIGVGGTGWLIQGEYFPTAMRGRAAAVGASVDWVANFALILLVPTLLNGIGLGWMIVPFAALSVLAILFVVAFLPETKELSVEEITEIFERQAGSDSSRDPARRLAQWAVAAPDGLPDVHRSRVGTTASQPRLPSD
jgi:Sugar (and other) transporter